MDNLSVHREAVTAVLLRAVGDNVGRNVLFRPLDVPFPASGDFFTVSGRAQTFAKMPGLLPCGSWLGVRTARPLQASVLGSQRSLRFMLLRPRAGCSRRKC